MIYKHKVLSERTVGCGGFRSQEGDAGSRPWLSLQCSQATVSRRVDTASIPCDHMRGDETSFGRGGDHGAMESRAFGDTGTHR